MVTKCHAASGGPTTSRLLDRDLHASGRPASVGWILGRALSHRGEGDGRPSVAGDHRRSWAWRQLLDTACVHLRKCIAHTPAGDQPVRRDLRERRQYEGAREQLRVWQREVRLSQNEVVIGDEVDIDRTRPPATFLAALAPGARAASGWFRPRRRD